MMFRRPVRELISSLWQDEGFVRLNRSDILDEIPVMHDHLAQIVAAGLGQIVYCPKALARYRQHEKNNIGAFYKARRGNDFFVRSLEVRLKLFSPFKNRLPEIGWDRIERFLSLYRMSRRPVMAGQLNYFVWLRNHSLGDYALAVLDCFIPSLYQSMRGLKG